MNNKSIYKQLEYCNNAKIIISHGGSFNFFNITMENGNLLVLNNFIIEEVENNIQFINSGFYTHYNNIRNTKNNIYIHLDKQADIKSCLGDKIFKYIEYIKYFLGTIN